MKNQDQDKDAGGISPLADSVNQTQLAASGMPTGGTDTPADMRVPADVPDPKDNPALPDDVSETVDPDGDHGVLRKSDPAPEPKGK